jgi:chromosomal replication initiator protein
MTDSVDVVPLSARRGSTGPFAPGEIATLPCDRCKKDTLPWDLRTFGAQSICPICYNATLELAGAAIRSMPDDEPGRLCSNCRALRDPALGSAWCAARELGDVRARICANFVSLELERNRPNISGSRGEVIDAWKAASEELRARLGGNFDAWFGHVEAISIEGGTLVLSAPDEHTREWLQERLHPAVRNALAVAGYPHLTPVYIAEPRPSTAGTPSVDQKAKFGFNPHYTFSEFIVGSGNRLAHASALACVDKPGQTYNPLVLYGGVGVGKTHLLQAIGQEAVDQSRGTVLYVTSETFTNELILAIREGATGAFRDRYRSVDFLLLDDIQFIAGKEATQEEFFHTFNALHQAGKQIVVTSDRHPGELRVLEDRLRSRFTWGLTADMQPPDLETRIAILRSKSIVRERRLPETVLNAVATRVGSNVRELEGTLNRVLAVADMLGTEPSMEVVRSVIGEPGGEGVMARPSDVLQAVSAYYRVKPAELSGPQRERGIAFARQIAMYLLREESKLSLLEVGSYLGGRNHSTVIYGCDKIASQARKGRVRQDLQAIKQLLYGTA